MIRERTETANGVMDFEREWARISANDWEWRWVGGWFVWGLRIGVGLILILDSEDDLTGGNLAC